MTIVSVAEDNAFAMKAIVNKLAHLDDVRVKHKAIDGAMLIACLEEDAIVDVVLMDIQMPKTDGIEATRVVKQRFPQIKVIMLTTFDDDDRIFESILAGASGYLLKEENSIDIGKAIKEIMDGGAPMSPAIALRVLQLVRQPITTTGPRHDFQLTPREIELLEQLKNGRTYDQIAANLIISNGTVRKHIENIYRKLQVNNKVDAVQKAVRYRIV